MKRNDGPPAIGVAQDYVASRLMVDDKTGTQERTNQALRSKGRESHCEETAIGTLRVLMISVGLSAGRGSPCFNRLLT